MGTYNITKEKVLPCDHDKFRALKTKALDIIENMQFQETREDIYLSHATVSPSFDLGFLFDLKCLS